MYLLWDVQIRSFEPQVIRTYEKTRNSKKMIVYEHKGDEQRWVLLNVNRNEIKSHFISLMKNGKKQFFKSREDLDEFYSRRNPRSWYRCPNSVTRQWNEFIDEHFEDNKIEELTLEIEKLKKEIEQREMIKQFTEKVALNKIARILYHPERYLGKKYIREWENIN